MREGGAMQSNDMLLPQVEIDTGVDKLIPVFVNHLGANKWSTMVACGSAFVSGVLVVLLVEALLILFVILRALEKRQPRLSTPHTSSVSVESTESSAHFSLQGAVWVAALPPGDVKKMYTKREKALKEKAAVKDQKGEQDNVSSKDKDKAKKDPLKDYIHVAPVWRYAKLQGRVLHLSHQGVKESILLEGCQIITVSGSPTPTRKWAKKYPIKLHNQSRNIYGGSHDCLLYLETGWEKEAWCGVLRASAATFEREHDDWFVKLKKEYQEYVLRVESQFPFLGRSGRTLARSVEDKAEKVPKAEAAANKKRMLWKKLTRRSMKVNRDNKGAEKASGEKASSERASSDAEDGGSSSRGKRIASAGPSLKIPRSVSVDDLATREPGGISDESQRMARASSVKSNFEISSLAPLERDPPEALASDSLERTLLYGNLLFARLFFDLYHSKAVCDRLRNVIQRQLAKVPSPSYIGKLNCTQLELGNSPPLAHNVRFLSVEPDGGWGLEADLQYFGGAILTIETRIDVRDSNAREKVVVQGLQESLAGAATADLLTRGLENLKTDFRIADDDGGIAGDQRNMGGTSTSARPADVRVSEEVSRKGWMQSSITNVKAMMSRVAEHVSQVPLALTIKVTQLKGTLQVRIKPPPSDRIWFSFTEMPNLELQPEPCIGDHKINSGPLGAFIINQIKILIRDSMVYPFCEDLSFSWMIAEAENWIPRDILPLAFVPEGQVDQNNQKERRETQLRREVSLDSRLPVVSSGVGPSNSLPGTPFQRSREDFGSPPVSPPRHSLESLSLPVTQPSPSWGEHPVNELTTPLLAQIERDLRPEESESIVVDVADVPQVDLSPQVDFSQVQGSSTDSDSESVKSEDVILLDSQPGEVRVSKRGKVFTFGKKMGNRLEEKGRSVIGRMRDRSDRSQRGSSMPRG